ncbi:hypothetical protein [Hungatella effluvii]|uniref:hypothetical protein n=1 Tax=Hungatella effluvii TaxID=1096246 RepID=UPI002A8242FE|nr:hypothetical protein [Hungatella effluvii]
MTKTKMEVMLPVEDMQEATEVAEFLESMTEKGQRAFMNFVRGSNFTAHFLTGGGGDGSRPGERIA